METAVDLIGTVPLFERLDASLHERIEAITDLVTAGPDEVLSHQGAMPECLHVLLEGQVALSSAGRRRHHRIGRGAASDRPFRPGLGADPLPYLMTARTVTRCRLLVIDAAGTARSGRARGAAGQCVAALGVARVPHHGAPGTRPEAAHRGAAAWLLPAGAGEGWRAAKADFRLPFDKGLLAARLGCRQENLSRAFATLRALASRRMASRVILHDIPRLKALAVPDDSAIRTRCKPQVFDAE